ncbi:ATP-grasp domain-containing protein [Bacteroidales bacterium OttesenSCG-928-K03]|nr:ATP-grasp domain-containing protein [Odoribacter sp. OttesenSCG-928-L07]MDL2239387.1 ATP-grasp domain-containing protein [Bacteroidales bacterium OttesenSCG-928-L14]MDL2240961.1 ATP-grasp domain-containing protein [Bacteroidales bacterium OttesenSCG-928-K22]MDL2242730.1 ATP-grasp domain-containing protein [Bacteroidales bacterium OttesenSCG-928-K03]
MNNKKRIAILGANAPLRSFYKQAKNLGFEIYSFAWEEGAVCKQYADHYYPISFINKEEILQICKKNDVNGVTSFSLESALPAVNYVARGINSPCNSKESEFFTENKFTMRERLKQFNINIPKYCLVNSENDIIDMDFPLIVKPIDSGGSRGVTEVKNKMELKKAINRALSYSKTHKAIVEQFIDGREFSVEFISHKGKHYLLSITDKITTGKPYFVELEHHQPAAISINDWNKIRDITEQMLDALEITDSPSHTEIKMDNNTGDFYIIEMGPRMGGDYITSDLVRLSTGYDFVKGTIDLAVGQFSEPEFGFHKYAGVYFLAKEREGILNYINNKNIYSQIVEAELYSENIVEVKENADRAGYLIYQANKKIEIKW